MTSKYQPTIGLEIHAQLNTQTKMFSRSLNDPDAEEPNVNVSPVDLGHPGTLPTINKEAVRHVLRVGVAVEGRLASYTEFSRKNYFYPDIPKGYQISQYQYPLVSGGELAGVELERIHLEEDTGKSIHVEDGSLLDFNRAGTPLMELVTKPVIHSASEAANFARELQLLLRTLGASQANLEKGEMRIEANISVSKTDDLGTKVEVKNLNSFRVVEKAINHEIKRHIQVLEEGGELVQETRGWEEETETTFSQRAKEEAHDYRYFPDPDLPALDISKIAEFSEDTLKEGLPELPVERRERYNQLDLQADQIEIIVGDGELQQIFDKTLDYLERDDLARQVANYLTSDLVSLRTEHGLSNLKPSDLAQIIEMIENDKLSSRGAKDALEVLVIEGGNASEIVEKKNLSQINDETQLGAVIKDVIADNESVVDDYKSGKEAALQYLVGQVMKETQGQANPQKAKEMIQGVI